MEAKLCNANIVVLQGKDCTAAVEIVILNYEIIENFPIDYHPVKTFSERRVIIV